MLNLLNCNSSEAKHFYLSNLVWMTIQFGKIPLLGGSFSFWTHDWKKVDKVWTIRSYSDVGDLKLMTSFECWYPMLMLKIVDLGYPNGKNCHQHLQVVPKTFRLKHPSPTSLWPPRAIETMLLKLYKDCRWFWIAQSRDIQKMIQSPACLISVLFRIREVFR